MPPTIYEQQISDLKVRFEFLPERLRYSIFDAKGHRSAFAAYEWIDVFAPGFSKRRAVGLGSFLLMGLALLAGAHYAGAGDAGMARLCFSTALLAAAAFFLLKWTDRRMTVLAVGGPVPGRAGPALCVLHDGQRQRILAELRSRWRRKMRDLHTPLDLSGEPDTVAERLNWLRRSGVITDLEHRFYQAQLTPARRA